MMLYTMKIEAESLPEKGMFKILKSFFLKKHPQSPRGRLGKNAQAIP